MSILKIKPLQNLFVRTLTISDIFIISSFGLIAPIFAVFIEDSIIGGNIEVAGLATMVYLLTKSIIQLPLAKFIDQIKGEKDDFWFMLLGSIATSLVPLFYLFITTPGQLYLAQFFYGASQAVTFPSWMAIFTRHIDKNKEAVEWGMYYTFTDLSYAVAAAMGGVIAYHFGFVPLFVFVSLLSFVGSFWLLCIRYRINT